MFQLYKEDGRYPDHITFAWQRSDMDYEILGTLNGETIEDVSTWNHLVEQTYSIMQYGQDNQVHAYEREDVTSVITPEEHDLGNGEWGNNDWIKIDITELDHESD